MTERECQSRDFLAQCGWGEADRRLLADDASFRRYERLRLGDGTAILMDAPPEFEDVLPFVAISRHLKTLGLAAPQVMARDLQRGFLLLEDMGDDIFMRVIRDQPEQERALYRLAIDGLIELHRSPPPENIQLKDQVSYPLPRYDLALLLFEADLFAEWYLPSLCGQPLPDQDRRDFRALWQDILASLTTELNCLVLRDYHVENLILRAGQSGLSRLGLLDYQDAVIGHRAYDLVSLLQDARRDVSAELEQEMIGYYLGQASENEENFRRDYAILGAQRNIKIIGIFTRLYLRDGKAGYLSKIPRVRVMLERDLTHPALALLKDWLAGHVAPSDHSGIPRPKPFQPAKAMILAAGLGLRMRPLTDHCPKPLIPFQGKPMLTHTLERLTAAGVRGVVINCHYLVGQVIDYVENHYDHRLDISLSDESQKLLDSGGGVKHALGQLGEDAFFVLNGDMVWQDGDQQLLHRMSARWQGDQMDILMLLVEKQCAHGYDGVGDFNMAVDGRLSPRGDDVKADYVYGGVVIIKPGCFDHIKEDVFSLREVFFQAAAENRLYGMVHDGLWGHVGTPEMRDRLEIKFGEK